MSLHSSNNGEYLVIDYSPDDRLLISGGLAGAVNTYEFADGERLNFAELIGRLMDEGWEGESADGTPVILGGSGDNEIGSDAGNALLAGGRGNDTVVGDGGGNTYFYAAGDGTDTLIDSSKANGFTAFNTLRFGSGIRPDDITLALGSLLIRVGDDPDSAIHIEGFDPGDVYAQKPIDRFEFADGSVLSYEQLLQRGFDLDGSDDDEEIVGTSLTDRIRGSGDECNCANNSEWRIAA